MRLIASALALIVAPVAQAQEDVCARYQPFLDAAPDGFEGLKGEDVSLETGAAKEGVIFASTVALEGFASCMIVDGRAEPDRMSMVACRQEVAAEPDARVLYDRELELLGSCLADWEQLPPDEVAADGITRTVDGWTFQRVAGAQVFRHGVALIQARWAGRVFWVHSLALTVRIEAPVS